MNGQTARRRATTDAGPAVHTRPRPHVRFAPSFYLPKRTSWPADASGLVHGVLDPQPATVFLRLEGLDALPQAGEFSREKLAAEAKIIALDWAREVFRRFGWDASPEVLREIQIRAG